MCACDHSDGKPTYRYKVNLNMADLLYMDGVQPLFGKVHAP